MRSSLTSAVLVVLLLVGLSATARLYPDSQPPSVAPGPAPRLGISNNTDAVLSESRDSVAPEELRLLVARNMLPPETKSLLKVSAGMRHGDYEWNDEGVPAGKVKIWVDLRRQIISVFRNGHEIGTAVIVYGAEGKSTPEGVFPILSKRRHYHSRTYDAPMPASLFITNDGVALHGSEMSRRRASHGCVGLPVEFAQKLFDAADVGNLVQITRSDALAPGDPIDIG